MKTTARALLGHALLSAGLHAADPAAPSRLGWWPHVELLRTRSTTSNAVVTTTPFNPGFPWREAVLSWNTASNACLTARARPIWKGESGPWYNLGHWCPDTNDGPRTSVGNQRDSIARVETDTLVLELPAEAIELEFTFNTPRPPADLRLGVSLLGSTNQLPTTPPAHRKAWGRSLDLPVRSQAEYPEGINSWCSPSSLSMILSYWANTLDRPDLLQDVPLVARSVHDPGWPGTGNWTFNTAYAGHHQGLSACVARLSGLPDLELWIEAGFPVATSISYSLLKGLPQPTPGDGHLVVVSGFTTDGQVRIHDPGVRRERVIKTVSRADFDRAWAHSSRTAYLVWPSNRKLPKGGEGRWPSND